MSDPVFLVTAVPAPGRFVLDGDEGRHAATVKRLKPGEAIVLTDGAGNWATAVVKANHGRALDLQVDATNFQPPPALTVVLVQALPKGDRSDLAVELATEAGVDEIIPWQASRCVARWDGSPDKADRGRAKWAKTSAEAAKQSRRRRIPMVHSLADSSAVAQAIADADVALVLHEDGSQPFVDAIIPARGRLLLIVGPEGGVAPEEISRFTDAGALPVRLGPEVLRTSTAGAVALGAIGVLAHRWS